MKIKLAIFSFLPLTVIGGEITDQFVAEAREIYAKDLMCQKSIATKYYAMGVDDQTPGKTVKWVAVEGVRNVRDIGGWTGLKAGMIYRGTELSKITIKDGNSHGYDITEAGKKVMLEKLGIKSDFDLRAPNKGSRGKYVTESALGEGVKLLDHPIGSYMDIFTYSGEKTYAKALKQFADPSIYPTYVHCAGGADRTGTICFLVETLCGVPLELARIDYELTGLSPVGGRVSNRESVQPFATMVRTLSTYPGKTFKDKVEYYALNVLKLSAAEIASIRNSLTGGSGANCATDGFREDVAKYWNFEELAKTPEWRECPFKECKYPGFKAMLVKGKGPNNTEAEFFAYYARPETTKDNPYLPGVVLTHGGGGTAYPEYIQDWVKKGFAVIAIDWYNRCPAPGISQYFGEGDGVKCCKTLKLLPGGVRNDIVANAANLVLAHSLLRSMPEVDNDRTVFVGLSWGSWYGAIVGAIDPRFNGIVEIYCGNAREESKAMINGRFLWLAKSPMWWITWTQDANVTPYTSQRGWEECAKYSGHFTGTDIGHSHYGLKYKSVERMAKFFTGSAAPLPMLGDCELKNGVLSAPIEREGLSRGAATLTYTLEPDPKSNDLAGKRSWKISGAKIEGDRVVAKLPKGARIAYLTLYESEEPKGDLGGSSSFYFNK